MMFVKHIVHGSVISASIRLRSTLRQPVFNVFELQIEELEEVIQTDYKEIEQEFDRLSHHEHIMQDCSYSLNALDS